MDKIIEAAIKIHQDKRNVPSNGNTISSLTKSSIYITKEWQDIFKSCSNILREVKCGMGKIDLVDLTTKRAYEMKVSGKNCHHEFYKDIIKVISYNLSNKEKLTRLVFLSEEKGIKLLRKNFKEELKSEIRNKHNIEIELVPISPK